MDSFVAFDIELANADPSSICEIAFVRFIDGKAERTLETLVRPNPNDLVFTFDDEDEDEDEDEDDGDLILVDAIPFSIHGIRPEDLESAPTLKDIWRDVEELIGDLPLVAHNATQDIKKLLMALDDQDLSLGTKNYYCTLTISRNEPSHSNITSRELESLSTSLDVTWFPILRPSGILGHSAGVDATASGEIMVKILDTGYNSLADLSSKLDLIPGKVVDSAFKNGNTKPQPKNPFWLAPSPAEFQSLKESLTEMGFLVRSDHIFFGKNFAISLWLENMNESDFWFCIALCGGNMKTSVSKFLDYLVEGFDPKGKYIRGNTTKSLKAKELQAKGDSHIQVLDEKTLLEMLGEDVLSDLESYRASK